jgi:hypothetical protein
MERPIIFSSEMVRAILEDKKTQTRRIIKNEIVQNGKWLGFENHHENVWEVYGDNPTNWDGDVQMNDWSEFVKCPYGQPGDRLWVRETTQLQSSDDTNWFNLTYLATEDQIEFKKWPIPSPYKSFREIVPSIHMPRWASRITLEIVNVSVERVKNISENDAWNEGVGGGQLNRFDIDGRALYKCLWDSINLKRGFGWDSNCWVWVIEFKRIGN